MKKLKLLVIGGGDRATCYLKYLEKYPEKFEVVGIAEPIKTKRDYFMEKYSIPKEACFESFEDALSLPRFADIAMICTQDKLHYAPAMMAIKNKYDILLEKPIATTPKECFDIANEARKQGVKTIVCHVLRYTPFYKAVKSFIDSGKLGQITNVEHTEGVGLFNMAHSYIRGKWRKEEDSTPMILAKCCHDTDIIQWLVGKPCTKVTSFGTLAYFHEGNAPENAPMRCLDNCPHKDECFFYAPKFYRIENEEIAHFRGIVADKPNPTDEEVDAALKGSQFERCVYHCDNNVVDRQIVSMQFGDDVCATLTMSPFNKYGRHTRIMGTKGEIVADMEKQSIEFYSFDTLTSQEIYEPEKGFEQSIAGGHGGGDMGLMDDLYKYVAKDVASVSVSGIDVSLKSHLIGFAAEVSRHNSVVVDIDEYLKTL